VLKSESITAEEALRLGVIDVVASDVHQLLVQLDNRRVETSKGERILKTRNALIRQKDMGMRLRILSVVSNPNIAYILLLVGLAGLYFEFANPGVILPGVIGGMSLILAFFALQTLPVNYAGVLLILFAVILFIAEIKIISHGLLTVGGIVSLVMGSLLLYDSSEPAMRVSLQVLVPTVTILSLFFAAVISLVVKAQLRRKHTGKEGMEGVEGVTVTEVSEQGKVLIKGEYWNAVSDRRIEEGKRIRVKTVEGLTLNVEEID